MTPRRARLLRRIESLEHDLAREVEHANESLRERLPVYIRRSRPLNLLAAPFVYSMVLPVALLDAWISLYQWICFPLFGVRRVDRQAYIVIDRHRLRYLNAIEKLNCLYCGYANGVLAYAREIAGRTEQYWCPIQHARPVRDPHGHYHTFVRYRDGAGYRRRLSGLRRNLK